MKSILITHAYPGYGFEKMIELTKEHHAAYCERYGIDFRPVVENITGRDFFLGAYDKIKLIQDAISEGYDNIIWLDADAMIWDEETNILDAIQQDKIGVCWHRIPQLNHWNVGVLYISVCDKTKQFIDEWFDVYPPPKDGWNEQGVFNRMAMKDRTVVTLSDKWNSTIDVSMVPDAVVLGFHGQGDAAQRYKLMQQAMNNKIAAKKAKKDSGNE